MKVATVISLFVLTSLFAVLLAIHVVLGRDIEPPDVSDLKVCRHDLPDDQNAFVYLTQVTNIYSGTNEIYELLEQIEEGTADEDYLADIIASNRVAFDLIEQGLNCERYQVPELASFDTPIPYVSSHRNIGRLIDVKAGWLLMRGKDEEAFETAMQNVRLGHLMQDGGGALINYLVAIAIKGIGLQRMEGIVMQKSLRVSDMKKYVLALKEYESADDGFENTFRSEYVFVASAVDVMMTGKGSIFGMSESGGLEVLARRSIYVFQPNRTKLMMADLTRHLIANVPLSYSEVEWPVSYWEEADGTLAQVRRILKPNSVGVIVVGMMQPGYDSCFDRRFRCTLYARSIGLLLALKAYQLDKNALPETLAALVPEYIDAVPIDPYDGQPIRYSPEEKLFYSVGRDCIDSGGTVDPKRDRYYGELSVWQRRDIIFKLDF